METWNKIYQRMSGDPQVWFGAGGFLVAALGIFVHSVSVFPLSAVNLVFFTILLILGALYRPNWCFLLLMAVVPFETVSVLPESFGFSLRPYQWVFLALSAALLVRIVSRRTPWPLFQYGPLDLWLALLPAGALLSGLIFGGQGIRLAAITVSFYALYLLGRVFLKTVGDVRIAFTTLFASGLAVISFGIIQNIAFEQGRLLQTVMPGRPNATFAEPDWLGLFASMLLILSLASFYRALRDDHSNSQIAPAVRIFLHALVLIPVFVTLILTVSRSAWLASFVAVAVWVGSALYSEGREALRRILQSAQVLVIVGILSLFLVVDLPLSRFDLLNRAQSTATGLQEITVACDQPTELPAEIGSVEDLSAFGCRHIKLEERETLAGAGLSIQLVSRPDPNVVIRSEIYQKTWNEIRRHPFFGIGWGNIGTILGQDENGAAYNASNVWLEVWLGAGIIGLLGLLGAFGYVVYRSIGGLFLGSHVKSDRSHLPLILSLVSAFLVFNLFNAGILIGFVWLVLAAVPVFLPSRKSH